MKSQAKKKKNPEKASRLGLQITICCNNNQFSVAAFCDLEAQAEILPEEGQALATVRDGVVSQ